jgi:hypothetical protein
MGICLQWMSGICLSQFPRQMIFTAGSTSPKLPRRSHKHIGSRLSHKYTINSRGTNRETPSNSSRRQIPRATDCQMFCSPTSISLCMAANHRNKITLKGGLVISSLCFGGGNVWGSGQKFDMISWTSLWCQVTSRQGFNYLWPWVFVYNKPKLKISIIYRRWIHTMALFPTRWNGVVGNIDPWLFSKHGSSACREVT